ncbi:glycoside hydrolase superfamily [Aspergillus aurantiobrunneus]
MHPLLNLTTLLAICTATSSASPNQKPAFNWRTTKSTGVNLGGWLVQEASLDTTFWNTHAPNAPDEWTLCQTLGATQCSSVLEHRYATFITKPDIDSLAAAGISLLRIPTTYAAWINLPGSALHSGNQTQYLREITEYAITQYDMHVIIDVHSLPGGLNGLDIGEAKGHWGWFYNETAWSRSMDVVDAVVAFIAGSGSPGSFTLEPMNEPTDRNREDDLGMAVFGTPEAISDRAAAYLVEFWKAVLERVRGSAVLVERGVSVPVMFQSFKLPEYWGGNFSAGDVDVVFDMHNYYFEGRNTTAESLPTFMLSDAREKSGDGSVPVFVGEWAVQAQYNNSFALRERNLKAGLRAWEEYMQGSAYWSAKFEGNDTVDGQGTKKDYWSLGRFIELGFLD